MQLTGAEIICECLLEQGVDTVFGYPGGAALNTYDALYKYSDRIRHILTAHEQGASHAADGYARATGKTGVVMTTSGPHIIIYQWSRPFSDVPVHHSARGSVPHLKEFLLISHVLPLMLCDRVPVSHP